MTKMVSDRRSRLITKALLLLGGTLAAAIFAKMRFQHADPFETFIADISWKTPAAQIGYVGSMACKECHAEEFASFGHSRMAVSSRVLDDAEFAKSMGVIVTMPSAFPFDYQVQQNGSSLKIVERTAVEVDAQSFTQTEELRIVIGSGAHARTCGLERAGGYLFQSPVTWYRALNGWALSPGYDRPNQRRFSRELLEDCLYCHTGQTRHVAGTRNQYLPRGPLDEIAIGCERCHGPGAKHVSFQENAGAGGTGADFVVNPAKLDFQLANDVCLQCHRSGQKALEVERPGREWRDFRPGMPVTAIIQQFIETGGQGGRKNGVHFNGKMSQLSRSRCFEASPGKLHCLTCHSIHHRPSPGSQIEHYRKACLNCHGQQGCKIPEPLRRKSQPTDSCIACHMAPIEPSDVPHTKITNHRIGRPGRPESNANAAKPNGLVAVDNLNIDPLEAQRNLGIAYGIQGGETGNAAYLQTAVRLLGETKLQFSGDARHRLIHGLSLAALGRFRLAVDALSDAVKIDDGLEPAHNVLATSAYWSAQKDLAARHVARSLEINPYRLDMLLLAAQIDFDQGNREAAKAKYHRVLTLQVGNREATAGLQRILALEQ